MMHVIGPQTVPIDDGALLVDLEQQPADIVLLSAADTELATFCAALAACRKAAQASRRGAGGGGARDGNTRQGEACKGEAWRGFAGDFSVRISSLGDLAHPASVDLYLHKTVAGSRLVLLRLLGGVEYWRYGVEQIAAMARCSGIAFAAVSGDAVWDADLSAHSTLDPKSCRLLWRYCVEGGLDNAAAALACAARILQPERPAPPPPRILPRAGFYVPGIGAIDAAADGAVSDAAGRARLWPGPGRRVSARPLAVIVFYRALLLSGQTAPVDALLKALSAQHMDGLAIFVASLREEECAGFVRAALARHRPDVVLNALAFALSQAGRTHHPTVLDEPGAPVLQIVFAATSRAAWADNMQGLAPRDLAMHVVLPEVDGRILTRAVAFKEQGGIDPATQSVPVTYRPDEERTAFVVQLAAAWARLRQSARPARKIAIILANYPNRDARIANGVGLDTPQSLIEILNALAKSGYRLANIPPGPAELMNRLCSGVTNAGDGAHKTSRKGEGPSLAVDEYMRFFSRLPADMRKAVQHRWGAPEDDPKFCQGGFALPVTLFGHVAVMIQPARGYNIDPKSSWHDPALVPPHYYFAAYFWLREVFGAHACIHLGKHGTLEWLPGKALALSASCYPEAVLGAMAHLYPFIVNDPGEGAQAKRRAGAVIIDHLTPPLTRAGSYGIAGHLEQLLDEYAVACGLDAPRARWLETEILREAARCGMDRDAGLACIQEVPERKTPKGKAQQEEIAARLARLDAHLCDLKELQIRDGLHVFGRAPEGPRLPGLLAALTRIARGNRPADESLLRALAADLALDGFDPLDCAFEEKWDGPRPPRLARLCDAAWRHNGDTIERLELLAARLIEEPQHADGLPATRAVLREIDRHIRPAVMRSGACEMAGLLGGLDGKFVEPGPSGAPSRGRLDVLPTGRNFYSVDIRGVPTPASWEIGQASARRLLERYFHDEGEWPRALALTCWGTANMRTGGDDIAQALALIGARPARDGASGRITGVEVIGLGELERPRVDVTLRVSGFFRDAFPAQIDLFQSAIARIATLDEPLTSNPLRAHIEQETALLTGSGMAGDEARLRASWRVFGARPGAYGAGLQAMIDENVWESRADLAAAFLAWGGYAYGAGAAGVEAGPALRARLEKTQAVVQNQDNREHDVLDSDDYYQFEGGMAAAVETVRGHAPRIYHNDHSRPERPLTRSLGEEIGLVVRGRAANPKWLEGVMRHGYKGAFEIAATLDYLFAFAATTNAVGAHHFDQLFAAWIEDEKVRDFLVEANPLAYREILDRFDDALQRGLWRARRNSPAAALDLERARLRAHQAGGAGGTARAGKAERAG